MKWLSIGLTAIVMFSAFGVVSDSYASTSLPKEIVTNYAQSETTDALKSATDQVLEWSENRACQTPNSWSCYQIQELEKTYDDGWAIIGVGVGALFALKITVLVSRLL